MAITYTDVSSATMSNTDSTKGNNLQGAFGQILKTSNAQDPYTRTKAIIQSLISNLHQMNQSLS